jgi:hypothetical protein
MRRLCVADRDLQGNVPSGESPPRRRRERSLNHEDPFMSVVPERGGQPHLQLSDGLVADAQCAGDRTVAHAEVAQVLRLIGDSQIDRHVRVVDDDGLDRDARGGSNSLRPRPPRQLDASLSNMEAGASFGLKGAVCGRLTGDLEPPRALCRRRLPQRRRQPPRGHPGRPIGLLNSVERTRRRGRRGPVGRAVFDCRIRAARLSRRTRP